MSSRCAYLCWLSECGIRCVSNEPPVSQLNGQVSVNRICLGVSNLDDGRSVFVQPAKELHNFFGLNGMEIARRLVGQQARRFVNYGASDSHQLVRASRELAGGQVFFGDDLEAIQSIGHQTL